MGSLAGVSTSPTDATTSATDDTTSPPELNDTDYYNHVLHLPGPEAQTALQRDLLAKAASLGIKLPEHMLSTDQKRNTSSAESQGSTIATYHARTFSSTSSASASTALTSRSLLVDNNDSEASLKVGSAKRAKNTSFTYYDRYLTQIDPNLDQPKFLKSHSVELPDNSAQSLFSVSTRRSFINIKDGLRRIRRKKKAASGLDRPIACICCRDDFDKSSSSYGLPCGHAYCGQCLRVVVQQAATDESKFPPRCCTQPIPSSILKDLLTPEERHLFLKAVRQFITPWDARIFCPNTACSEFIPPRSKLDPKHPFDVECRNCDTRVCIMCKRNAHPIGKECPEDWELNEVLKMGEKSGWRRCYKCRALVELAQGCTHMTCRCKAQFCYICGAIWNLTVGCPNFCDGTEELERRQIEEQARTAELDAEKAARDAAAAAEAAQTAEAERRMREHPAFLALQADVLAQRQRFQDFVNEKRWHMEMRHGEKKAATVARHTDQTEKMEERHAKTASHLDERQIEAEMELRMTLQQSENSVKIRLKHMEAYCEGLGHGLDSELPKRVVTERDLQELGQQYNLRDGMARLHQSKINVLRDRQAKRMEELLERQANELEKLADRKEQELEALASDFAQEEDELAQVFSERKRMMLRVWSLRLEVLRNELEDKDGLAYVAVGFPPWNGDYSIRDDAAHLVAIAASCS
ncbi:IBR domain-containing protein [Verticillium dahliae]|nr:IBR domain-containing protein [Verticillium dahliae]